MEEIEFEISDDDPKLTWGEEIFALALTLGLLFCFGALINELAKSAANLW
jgi:hypothetical protein